MEVTQHDIIEVSSSRLAPVTLMLKCDMPEHLREMRCADLLCKHTWGSRAQMSGDEAALYDATNGMSNWTLINDHLVIISDMERDGYRNAVRIVRCDMADGSARLVCDNLHTLIRYMRLLDGMDTKLGDVPFYLVITDGYDVRVMTDGKLFRSDVQSLDGIVRAALYRYVAECSMQFDMPDERVFTVGDFLDNHRELLSASKINLTDGLSDADVLAVYNAIQQRCEKCSDKANWGGDYWKQHDLLEMLENRHQWHAYKREGEVLAAVRIIPWDDVKASTKRYLRGHDGWSHNGYAYALQLVSLEKGAGHTLLENMPCKCVGDVLSNRSTAKLVKFYEGHPSVKVVGSQDMSEDQKAEFGEDAKTLLVEIAAKGETFEPPSGLFFGSPAGLSRWDS